MAQRLTVRMVSQAIEEWDEMSVTIYNVGRNAPIEREPVKELG
jgi:hypothetical protein